MASAGWYPDPGGQPGVFRYWDGHAWSAATTANPAEPPPSQGIGQSSGPDQQPAYATYRQSTTRRSTVGWWIGGGLGLIAIIVVIALLVRSLGGGSLTDPFGPGGESSQNPCPTSTSSAGTSTAHPNDGRVHGGPLSYPQLGSPWGPPKPDDRVPFGSDVQSQTIVTESDYRPGNDWLAGVMIAQLIAGDGFFTPQQGSEIVAKCIVGTFYGDNPVQRDDQESKATHVDGHDAWYLRSHLTFDVDGLQTKGELMTIVIIDAGDISGLYYASIPDNAKQYQPDADKVLDELTVDS